MKFGKDFLITDKNIELYVEAIATWIKQKVRDANAKGVVLGMSGGVDCSVVALLCKRAKIPVQLILFPYGDNMLKSGSLDRSMELINNFSFKSNYHIHDIQPAVDAAMIPDGSSLLKNVSEHKIKLARANLRARERTQYQYQYAGLHDMLVIGTTNLDEFATGYFTKFGDSADINPILLLTKGEVYLLAKYLGVPDSIIHEKPSAELWVGQTDEDELGFSYELLDKYLINGTSGSIQVDELIEFKINSSAHKRDGTYFYSVVA